MDLQREPLSQLLKGIVSMKSKVYFGLVLFYIETINHPFFFNVIQQAEKQPKDTYQSYDRADIYIDWFPSAEKMNDYKNMLIRQVFTDEKERLSKLKKEIVSIEIFKQIMTTFSTDEAIIRLKNKEKVYLIPPVLTERMFYHEISRAQEFDWICKKVSLKSGVPKEKLFIFYDRSFEKTLSETTTNTGNLSIQKRKPELYYLG